MKQEEAFLKGEGDAWFRRNKDKMRTGEDKVLSAIRQCSIKPVGVLEYGCCDGYRLIRIRNEFKCECVGVEPAWAALYEGRNAAREAGVHMFQGSAATFDVREPGLYDLVIFGFCLYLCDREDLFKIVMLADRVLADGGHLIIHDFFPNEPQSRIYEHAPELRSYKMDHSKLFTCNPAYKLVEYFAPDNEQGDGVAVLRKDLANAWPLR